MNDAMSNPVTLRIFNGDELVEQRTIDQRVIKIGKLESSDVHLPGDAIARMHAVIEVSGSDVRVIDLGSTSGTSLNGARVHKNAAISDGDRLQVGPYHLEVVLAPMRPVVSEAAPVQRIVPAARAQRPAAGAVATAYGASPTREHAPPRLGIDADAVERLDGSTVAEVMAVYGETVLDVQHVGQTKSRRASAPLFLGLGGLLLLGGASLFAHDAVLEDWSAFSEATAQAAASGRPAPVAPGWGTGGLGIALALLGLVPFGLGVVRLGDTGVAGYTIGEGHHASFKVPASGLPAPEAFPLVSPSADGGNVLNFTNAMRGEVVAGGETKTLVELAASGHVRRDGSIYAFPLPAGAHCEVEHQGLKFIVNAVPPGKRIAGKSETDKPFWLYSAASMLIGGSLLTLAHLAMPSPDSMGLDAQLAENRFVGYVNQPDEVAQAEPPIDESSDVGEAGGEAGAGHNGNEGAAGNPAAKATKKAYAMKGPKDAVKQLARNFDPDVEARTAGILGLIQQDSGHFIASPYGGAFAMGNDDEDFWGGLTGTELGESHGSAGLGLIGVGRGGGREGEGVLGLGRVGLIGRVGSGSEGLLYGRGANTGFKGRGRPRPRVRSSKITHSGAMDKDVIRRVVRAHINEVRHCYNQGLVRDPNLKGRVAVQFSIGSSGRVPFAVVGESSIKDKSVSNCVAKAVRRWKFPRPERGGNVIVTYPFVLSPG